MARQISLVILFIIFAGCTSQHILVYTSGTSTVREADLKALEKEYGRFENPGINVSDLLNRITDSLSSAGIDSMIVIRRACKKCHSGIQFINKNPNISFDKIPVAWSEPAYIFWVDNNRFFVKKIDQFGSYKIIERTRFQHYPLYDYYRQNNTAIKSETVSFNYGNSGYGSYVYKDFYYSGYYRIPDVTSLLLKAGSEKYSYIFNLYYFQPVADVAEEESIKKQHVTPNSSTRIGNDEINYYNNQQLKVYSWKLLIESELFEIERLRLW